MPKSQISTTTGLSRRHRHGPVLEELGFASRFVSGKIEPQPAITTTPPRPAGELRRAPIDRIAQLVTTAWEGAPVTCHQRGQAASIILTYLTEYPGQTWQQRWDASPMGMGEANARILGSRRETGMAIGQGLRSLFCLRVIQPSLLAFRANSFHEYGQFFVAAQSDPLIETFAEQVAASDLSWAHQREALSTCAACSPFKASASLISPRPRCFTTGTRPAEPERSSDRERRTPTGSPGRGSRGRSRKWIPQSGCG